MIEVEQWKTISELGKRYSVSNYGNVKNNKTGKQLKFRQDKGGYLVKTFKINNKNVYTRLHRLVLTKFKPIKTPNLFDVHHIDYDQTNNHLSNLEWLSPLENAMRKQIKEKSFQIYRQLRKKYGEKHLIEILNNLLNNKSERSVVQQETVY